MKKSNTYLGSKMEDHRDVDNTDLINQTIGYYLGWVVEKAQDVLEEAYPLIVRPIAHSVTDFFKGDDGQFRWYQPGADLMMLPANAGLTLLDGFMPINTHGGWGLPTAPILARLMQLGQLMSDTCNTHLPAANRLKSPVAAMTAATLAVYLGLQAIAISENILINGTFSISALVNPYQIVQDLMQGNTTTFQKFLILTMGYIAATNGFIKGKEVVLHELQAWSEHLWKDIQTDKLIRHLKALSKIVDKDEADKIQTIYEQTVKQGQDWQYIDFTGRIIERLLHIPASILRLPSNNTQYITLPKAWLQKNGYVQNGADWVSMGAESITTSLNISRLTTGVSHFLGWSTPKAPRKPDNYPSYQSLLDTKKKEYWTLSYTIANTCSFFKNRDRLSRDEQLNVDLIHRYTQDVFNHKLGYVVSEPVFPINCSFLPAQENWKEIAQNHSVIQAMLAGKFPEPLASLEQKARLYNETLYKLFSGEMVEAVLEHDECFDGGKKLN